MKRRLRNCLRPEGTACAPQVSLRFLSPRYSARRSAGHRREGPLQMSSAAYKPADPETGSASWALGVQPQLHKAPQREAGRGGRPASPRSCTQPPLLQGRLCPHSPLSRPLGTRWPPGWEVACHSVPRVPQKQENRKEASVEEQPLCPDSSRGQPGWRGSRTGAGHCPAWHVCCGRRESLTGRPHAPRTHTRTHTKELHLLTRMLWFLLQFLQFWNLLSCCLQPRVEK